ncbi:MAG: UDP-N-acetylglucosamine 4,6-dehydratase [Planctomycetes bacterium RBG_16_64_10]|nr:MAG: UDP-N-acetylglucosamine 4,6-dehydratase [Planctomycetes bacterium RBG_16_64_10]
MWQSTEATRAVLGRTRRLFEADMARHAEQLAALVEESSFLVLGGAGTIGAAVTKELFQRQPRRLHVIDISENNLVELVRDIRSSLGYIAGDFRTLPLDCGSLEFHALLDSQPSYDYVLNLSALKHVRSEKDPYTLMRMIAVNVLNTERLLQYAARGNVRKYFGVSTDKAVRPTNAMGASKRVMELCMLQASRQLPVSTARFANVAFSDGSLLHGFIQRIRKRQPLSAPRDVQRYFITMEESGQLCLMSCLLGENRDLLFPKLTGEFRLTRFDTIAIKFLESLGYEAEICQSEDEARSRVAQCLERKKWPCYFFDSDTTGEKDYEEFYTDTDRLDLERFDDLGVVQHAELEDLQPVTRFLSALHTLRQRGNWTREEILAALRDAVPDFCHKETRKYLDSRM